MSDVERDVDPDRVARAATALEDGTAHVRPGTEPGEYTVPSFTTDATYIVNLEGRTCTCPDAMYRGATCKHQYAAALTRGLAG